MTICSRTKGYCFKEQYAIVFLLFCNLKILKQGIKMQIFFSNGLWRLLKNGHLPVKLYSSAPPGTFKKNNKRTKNTVNCFLQDDASAGMWSLQISFIIKLFQTVWNGLYVNKVTLCKVSKMEQHMFGKTQRGKLFRVSPKICYNPGNSTLLFRRLVMFFPGV